MAASIHQTALVDEAADIADDVTIGPYCVVGPKVSLSAGVTLKSHVVVEGNTSIGEGTIVFPFASLGGDPQDLKFEDSDTRLEIGARNRIREYVTMNPGTVSGGGLTKVGDDGLYMASSHIAHDCVIGNNVVLANSTAIAGHCHIGNHVIFGGLSCIHQFGRVGDHAFIGGASAVERDVIPYGMAIGNRAVLAGLNLIGLKRRGFNRSDVQAIRQAYRDVFEQASGTIQDRAKAVGDLPVELMRACQSSGRAFHILGIKGAVDPSRYQPLTIDLIGMGEVGRAIKSFQDAGCVEVCMAGRVRRPDLRSLKVDRGGLAIMPKLLKAARKGDGALLDVVTETLEGKGLKIVGADDVLASLRVAEGSLTKAQPDEVAMQDVQKGIEVANALGLHDVAQATVICHGLVLAVEAAEGTDEMLARINDLPADLRGSAEDRRGVLVKWPKPIQDRRTDLPVVGLRTVKAAIEAGLCGIAIRADGALLMDREAAIALADQHGLFITALSGEDG
ncbi:lpxA [Symbiodinium microadriaticum]|nr:lpxA [Symbiodinium microadriaticum]